MPSKFFYAHNAPAPDRMNARVMVLVDQISLLNGHLFSILKYLTLSDVPGDWQQANVSLVQRHGSCKIQLFHRSVCAKYHQYYSFEHTF